MLTKQRILLLLAHGGCVKELRMCSLYSYCASILELQCQLEI